MKAFFFRLAALSAGLCMANPAPEAASPEKQDTIPIKKVADAPVPPKEKLDAALRRGVDFLVAKQLPNGAWGDHTLTKGLNVLCPFPEGPRSFQISSTALCVIGILSTPYKDEPAVKAATDKALKFLMETLPKLKRGDTQTLLSVWGHTYGLEALCLAAQDLPKDSPLREKYKKQAAEEIKALDRLGDTQGGWGYYTFETFSNRPIGEPTSFLTATVLVSLKDAQRVFDLKSDQKVFTRAMYVLKEMRTPAGAYVYSNAHRFYPGRLINRHTGSLARTPAGDYALKIWDDKLISTRQLEDGLERLWSRAGWLTMSVKKPIPHESFAQNSGYFYYYGYYYVARCLELVPKDKLKRHAAHIAADILPMQEKDGTWWDYPLYNYHKFYGTGYALYTISKARNALYPENAK